MSSSGKSTDEIKLHIQPILDKVAVAALRAWLKTVGLSSSAYTKAAITELVAKQIADGKLTENALEQALIGFEEASDMRVYIFKLEDVPSGPIDQWLPARIKALGIPITTTREFAGDKTKPMSPVYARIEGSLLRVKWAEEHQRTQLDENTFQVKTTPVFKRAVLVADIDAATAELRLNPPENNHAHEDNGRISSDAYYKDYIQKARDVLGCTLVAVELRPVVKALVDEAEPRVIRIHIDNHTNQTNGKMRVNTSNADVRDDPDWQIAFKQNGHTWAWDNTSFYWLPKASSKLLARELFSHIDAEDGYVKVNADCSDEEVIYVVSQIRAR